jgi:signal transduction histidine kinase
VIYYIFPDIYELNFPLRAHQREASGCNKVAFGRSVRDGEKEHCGRRVPGVTTAAGEELDELRDRVFRVVLYVTLGLGLATLSTWTLTKHDSERFATVVLPFWGFYAALALVGLFGRTLAVRAGVYLAVLFVGGTFALVEYGFRGQGPFLYLGAVAMTAVFLGRRASAYLLVLELAVTAVVGFLFVTERLVHDAVAPLTSWGAWVSLELTLTFIGVSMYAAVGVVMDRLAQSLERSRGLVKKLEAEVAAADAARAELDRLNADLERRITERTEGLARVNEELQAFSYTVSHDLRAPLRHVNAYVGMLRERAAEQLDSESLRFMDTIEKAADRMASMIDHLLHFYRLGRAGLSLVSVDLRKLVDEVLAERELELSKRRVELVIGELGALRADRSLMKQVLSNLLDNALKYSSRTEHARVEISAERGPGEVVVRVTDNGVGFDPAHRERLFQVFQRLHPEREFEGSGIGLAHVRRIIERHGGRVWAEGAVGAGASFFFSIPEPSAEHQAKKSAQ